MTTAMTFEGADELQEAAAQEAMHYAQKVKAMRTQLGTQHVLRFHDFGDGMSGYFISTPYIERAHLIVDGMKSKVSEIRERFGLRTYMDGLGVPDIAAGVVISPVIEEMEIDPEKVEGATPEEIEKGDKLKVNRIKNLKVTERTEERIGVDFTHQRMAVELVDSMKTLADDRPVAGKVVRWSQHRRVRPGNYTGKMREVVQLLLGLGNVSHNTYELKEKEPLVKLTTETAKKFIEEIKDGIATIKEEIAEGGYVPPKTEEDVISGFGLYEEGVNVKVQLNYDYRFHKSHGIVKAEDDARTTYIWEISNEGMFVIPMPIDPYSKTEEGAKRYKELYPELEDTGLMDFLGGFPTGEQVPVSINKKRAVNAGEMRQVLSQEEMREFYGKQPYYSNQGWAFAETMPVAMNCCRNYDEDKVMVGYLYSASVTIDERSEEPAPAAGAAALIGKLRGAKLLDKLMYANKKIPRMSEAQVSDIDRQLDAYLRAVSAPGTSYEAKKMLFDAFEEKFDDIEVEPVINATGVIAESRRGFVYHPAVPYPPSPDACHVFSQQPQIKFPEEMLGHGVSLDLSRAVDLPDRDPPNPKPICDTVIWVWPSGNTFKYINYQWKEEDPGDEKEPENDRGECQYDGKWTEVTEGGDPVQCGHFYTSDVDLRQKLVTQGTKTVSTTGHPRGYKDVGSWSCWGFPSQNPFFRRHVYYSFDVETKKSGSRNYNSAVAVPFGSRSTYYTIETETRYGKERSLSIGEAKPVGTTGSTRWGHIIDYRDYIIKDPSQNVSSIEYTLPFCHLINWCLPVAKSLPANVDPVVLTEWTPVDPTSGCFAVYGPPDFPDYSPSPNRYPEPGCDKPELPDTVQNIPGYSTSDPVKNSFKYEIRLWGQPGLEDNRLKYEEHEWEDGEEFVATFDTEMSGWWFIYMPTMCDTYSSISVNASWWGAQQIGSYQYQWDDDEVAYGDPVDLHASVRATYFGYIE